MGAGAGAAHADSKAALILNTSQLVCSLTLAKWLALAALACDSAGGGGIMGRLVHHELLEV